MQGFGAWLVFSFGRETDYGLFKDDLQTYNKQWLNIQTYDLDFPCKYILWAYLNRKNIH